MRLTYFRKKLRQIFLPKGTEDDLSKTLLTTYKRLKMYEPNAKVRIPYYLKILLLKNGFKSNEVTEKETDMIPRPERDLNYLDLDKRSN